MTRPTPSPREARGDCYWGRFSDGSPCTLPGHNHLTGVYIPLMTVAGLEAEVVRLQHIEEELTALVAAWRSAGHIREYADAVERILGRLVDPDCRDGKHGSCAADPCDCPCHHAVEVVGSLPGVDLVSLDGSHVHYYRQTVGGLACSCGATVTA